VGSMRTVQSLAGRLVLVDGDLTEWVKSVVLGGLDVAPLDLDALVGDAGLLADDSDAAEGDGDRGTVELKLGRHVDRRCGGCVGEWTAEADEER